MSNRHQRHMTNDVMSALGLMSAGGPVPFFILCGLVTLAALGLLALSEPGKTICGACVLILPIVALRVGSVRGPRGGHDKRRLAIAGGLVLGAILAYQVQWGALGGVIHEAQADGCRIHHLYDYGPGAQATSWFIGCRDHLSKDEVRQACTRLMHYPESNTWQLRLAC